MKRAQDDPNRDFDQDEAERLADRYDRDRPGRDEPLRGDPFWTYPPGWFSGDEW